MPYNTELEQRMDKLASQFGEVVKKKMFGGIGYLLNGNMAFGIHKQSLVIRVSPERSDELLQQSFVSLFNMTGRPMPGWLLVAPDGLKTDEQLLKFLHLAVAYVKTLPPK